MQRNANKNHTQKRHNEQKKNEQKTGAVHSFPYAQHRRFPQFLFKLFSMFRLDCNSIVMNSKLNCWWKVPVPKVFSSTTDNKPDNFMHEIIIRIILLHAFYRSNPWQWKLQYAKEASASDMNAYRPIARMASLSVEELQFKLSWRRIQSSTAVANKSVGFKVS